MRRLFFLVLSLAVAVPTGTALDRQPNADYRARREALAKKAEGIVLLFAPVEAPGEVYGLLARPKVPVRRRDPGRLHPESQDARGLRLIRDWLGARPSSRPPDRGRS